MVTIFRRYSPCLKTVHTTLSYFYNNREQREVRRKKPEMIPLTEVKSENFNKTDLL